MTIRSLTKKKHLKDKTKSTPERLKPAKRLTKAEVLLSMEQEVPLMTQTNIWSKGYLYFGMSRNQSNHVPLIIFLINKIWMEFRV